MKKAAPWILLVLTLHSQSLQASLGEKPANKVPYSREIPKGLHNWIARGAHIRFFGRSTLQYKGRPVFIQVYDTAKTDFSEKRATYGARDYAPNDRRFQAGYLTVEEYGVQKVGVALFIADGKRRGRFRRINIVGFNYIRFVNKRYGSSETVGVQWLWLNRSRRTVPSILIDFRDRGELGANGTEALVSFPNGLARKASVLCFGYGADNSSSSDSWFSEFGAPDDSGFLTIHSVLSTISDETTSRLKWNGERFIATTPKTITRDRFKDR